jgi:signal transduction histidine kinase/ActR/RegA family two-component response regulator
MKLRVHLLLLALAMLVPITIFGVFAAVQFVQAERATFERGARERMLAISTAVDIARRTATTRLAGLAPARPPPRPDLRAFYDDAARILQSRPDWITINLARPSGQQVLNLLRPLGGELPPVAEGALVEAVARTRRPAVGGMLLGPVTGRHDFAVRVPVVRGGVTRYVLSAVIRPEPMGRLLAAQRLPADWSAVVVDANHRIVSRTVAPDRSLGALAPEGLRAALARAPEGSFQGSTLEGAPIFMSYARSPFSGWTVAMGIPPGVVTAAQRRTTWTMGLGLLGAAVTAAALALTLGRRVTTPITRLAAAAEAVGRGLRPEIPRAITVQEVGVLARMLDEAAEAVRAREVAQAQLAADQQRADAERARLLANERSARQEAEAASRAKDVFLAMLSHELRNPLGAISTAVRLLDRVGRQEEPAVRARAVITRQTEHLARLVDDLLDVARVMSGKIVLERRPVDLAECVQRSVDTLRAAGRLEHHAVTVTAAPAWVRADEVRVEQIVTNLVGNALKFTPPAGRIGVDVRADADEAVLRVEDSGVGITGDLLPRVFDAFAQGDQASDRTRGGLGIGLALVRHLVELQQGRVEASSAGVGLGSVFTVRLPRIAAPAPAPAPPAPVPAPPQHRRVLLVEDNEDTREVMRRVLELAGHRVTEAADGAAAVEAARRFRPDAAVVDIGIPGLDGYAVARQLRAAAETKGMLLVAVTGYGMPEDRQRSSEAGFDVHLVKPVDVEALTALLAGAGTASRPD